MHALAVCFEMGMYVAMIDKACSGFRVRVTVLSFGANLKPGTTMVTDSKTFNSSTIRKFIFEVTIVGGYSITREILLINIAPGRRSIIHPSNPAHVAAHSSKATRVRYGRTQIETTHILTK